MKEKTFFEFTQARRSARVAFACCLVGLPCTAASDEIPDSPSTAIAPLGDARVTGEVVALDLTAAQLALRNGQIVTVDLSAARNNHMVAPVFLGEFLVVQGRFSAGVMTAMSAFRAKSNPNAWAPDIP